MTDIATFENKYGEEQTIHKTRHGLKVKRTNPTPILQMNQAVGAMIGQRVKDLREERGWTLVELATRCGMHSGHPKSRMWEIENSVRREGVRLGTLYALAMALGVEVADLMPPVDEVAAAANVRDIALPSITNGNGTSQA